jgi:hypothetical protein
MTGMRGPRLGVRCLTLPHRRDIGPRDFTLCGTPPWFVQTPKDRGGRIPIGFIRPSQGYPMGGADSVAPPLGERRKPRPGFGLIGLWPGWGEITNPRGPNTPAGREHTRGARSAPRGRREPRPGNDSLSGRGGPATAPPYPHSMPQVPRIPFTLPTRLKYRLFFVGKNETRI